MARELIHRPKDRWAYFRRTDRANSKLVIFVHGFWGDYLDTWGDLGQFLKEHADYDKKLMDWDHLFVGYETYSIDTYLAIAEIIRSHWLKAVDQDFPFDNNCYTQLALFGHSLGTLGVRQFLCAASTHPKGLAEALQAVVLFGSPLNGSPLAGMAGAFRIVDFLIGKPAALLPRSYRIGRALKEGNAELLMLNVWNETMRLHGKLRIKKTRVILGADDLVVGRGKLSTWDGDETVTTSMDHSEMVKVSNDGSNTDGTVIDELRRLGKNVQRAQQRRT